jgi:hypothetical protein
MRHRRVVRELCFKCGLYWQGLTHDLSKYSPTEFFRGVKYYTGKASPHEGEREDNGYSLAWLHHKARNKHHREYWQDRVKEKTVFVQMPTKYLAEMICDRVGACMVYLGVEYTSDAPLEYYKSKNCSSQFHEVTATCLELWLSNFSKYGNEQALKMLKQFIKDNKEV